LPLAIFSGRGLATHNYNQQAGEMGIELLICKVGPRLQRSGEHFEGALKAQEESTSAEGRLTEEDVLSVGASGKEENEHTQEWWEGYDPGMDASF
jgi:hypothetical protein